MSAIELLTPYAETFQLAGNEHGVLVFILLLVTFSSDAALYACGVLSGMKALPTGILLILSSSLLVYDMVAYAAVNMIRKRHFHFLETMEHSRLIRKARKHFDAFEEHNTTHPLLFLFLLKVLPLSRVTILLYLFRYKLPFTTFLKQDCIVFSLWFLIFFLPGYAAGSGLFSLQAGNVLVDIFIYIIVFLILVYIFQKTIKRIVMKTFGKKMHL